MKKVKTLNVEVCERLKEDGVLESIVYERLPNNMGLLEKDYLQSRAKELGADLVGIPLKKTDFYGYYKSSIAEENTQNYAIVS